MTAMIRSELPLPLLRVGKVRDLSDVVGNRGRGAADAGENGQVARSRQIRTEQAVATNFQFGAEQSVLNLRRLAFWNRRKFVSASAHLQNALAIDSREPGVAESSCDLFQVRRG